MTGIFSNISDEDLATFLTDLQTAYLTGASLVSFQGMQTQYNTPDQLRRKILEVQGEIESRLPEGAGKKRTKRVYVQTDNRGF